MRRNPGRFGKDGDVFGAETEADDYCRANPDLLKPAADCTVNSVMRDCRET